MGGEKRCKIITEWYHVTCHISQVFGGKCNVFCNENPDLGRWYSVHVH